MAAEEGLDEEVGHLVGDGDDAGEDDDPENRALAEDDAEAFEDVSDHALRAAVTRVGGRNRGGVQTVGAEFLLGARGLAEQQGDEPGGGHRAGADQEDGLEAPETGHRSAKERRAEQRAGHHGLGAAHVLFVFAGPAEDAQAVVQQCVAGA